MTSSSSSIAGSATTTAAREPSLLLVRLSYDGDLLLQPLQRLPAGSPLNTLYNSAQEATALTEATSAAPTAPADDPAGGIAAYEPAAQSASAAARSNHPAPPFRATSESNNRTGEGFSIEVLDSHFFLPVSCIHTLDFDISGRPWQVQLPYAAVP